MVVPLYNVPNYFTHMIKGLLSHDNSHHRIKLSYQRMMNWKCFPHTLQHTPHMLLELSQLTVYFAVGYVAIGIKILLNFSSKEFKVAICLWKRGKSLPHMHMSVYVYLGINFVK